MDNAAPGSHPLGISWKKLVYTLGSIIIMLKLTFHHISDRFNTSVRMDTEGTPLKPILRQKKKRIILFKLAILQNEAVLMLRTNDVDMRGTYVLYAA